MWLAQYAAHGVAGDQQFFVGGYGIGSQWRVLTRDEGLHADRRLIAGIIQEESGPLQACTNLGTNLGRIFPDTPSEDNGIGSSHSRQICADILSHAIAEHIHSQADTTVIMLAQLLLQDTHIVGQTRDTE